MSILHPNYDDLQVIGELHVFPPGHLGSGFGTGGLASIPALPLTGCVTWESPETSNIYSGSGLLMGFHCYP